MDIKCDTILSMIVDNEAPPRKVTINGKTYTLTVGGTVGTPVDLGLPSGTLWASHNIGAIKPEEDGAFLQWGELGAKEEGYTNGVKSVYNWSSHKYCNNGSWTGITKYTYDDGQTSGIWYNNGTFVGDGKTTLEPMDDAATVNWGDEWTMPTFTQMQELNNTTYTTWTWTTLNGVKGYKVTSKQNGNSIFLPTTGGRYDNSSNDSWGDKGSAGYYWTSSLYTNYTHRGGRSLRFDWGGHYAGGYDIDIDGRYNGFCVRPVRAQKKEIPTTTTKVDGQIAGHDYVEIGGKKWATMNIGATSVASSDAVATPSYIQEFTNNYTDSKVYSCFGTYFKWGETTATDGTKSSPTLNSCDNPTLCSKHDAATVNWGSTWRTPTRKDMQALSNACAGTTSYSTPKALTAKIEAGGIYWLSATQTHEPDYKGVAGVLFVDKADPTKRVFFPAAGDVLGTTLYHAGSFGYYWSSSLYTGNTGNAWYLGFGSGFVRPGVDYNARYDGFTVRPVSD